MALKKKKKRAAFNGAFFSLNLPTGHMFFSRIGKKVLYHEILVIQ